MTCLVLATAPARAFSVEDVVSLRVLPGWQQDDGRLVAGLQIDMAPGWHTYWRQPGGAGIPPQFDWTGSRNLGEVEVVFPTPAVIEQNGLVSIGYEGRVIFPLLVRPEASGPVALRGHMLLGVCEEICIPVEVTLTADLSAPGAPDAAIKAALADQPRDARALGLGPVTCRVTPIEDGLRAEFHLPGTGGDAPRMVVVEPALPGVWVSVPAFRREGAGLVASVEMVPPEARPFVLDRSKLRLTTFGPAGTVEFQGCTGG